MDRREIAHQGQRYAARAGIARKHDIQIPPFSDAADSSPLSGLGSGDRAGLGAGQPHKVTDLQDRDGAPIGAEIKLHGVHFAQSLRD